MKPFCCPKSPSHLTGVLMLSLLLLLVLASAASATQVTVSFDKLARNTKRFQEILGQKKLIATLKGGYGLDHAKVTDWFARLGIHAIAVDDVSQASKIRDVLDKGGHKGIELLALKGFFSREEAATAANKNITPVIAYPITWEIFQKLPQLIKNDLKLQLFVNTGTNDQGLSPENTLKIASAAKQNVTGVLSHFTSADTGDVPTSLKQLRSFNSVVREIKQLGIELEMVSMAKTLGIPMLSEGNPSDNDDHTHVRVGKGFWAGFPNFGTSDAIRYETEVRAVTDQILQAGDHVGYGGWKVPPNAVRKIFVLGVGFEKGVPVGLTHVMLPDGSKAEVAGVRMGHTSLAVPPETNLEVGDSVVIYGDDRALQSLQEVSRQSGKKISDIVTGLRFIPELVHYQD